VLSVSPGALVALQTSMIHHRFMGVLVVMICCCVFCNNVHNNKWARLGPRETHLQGTIQSLGFIEILLPLEFGLQIRDMSWQPRSTVQANNPPPASNQSSCSPQLDRLARFDWFGKSACTRPDDKRKQQQSSVSNKPGNLCYR
jgi:hypothetical protein